jgi:hypothetical protein
MHDAHDRLVLVIGTRHEYLANRAVDVIAEEAGNDEAVAAMLTHLGFPQGPKEPIARQEARGAQRDCRHCDIRPQGGEAMTQQQYEEAMCAAALRFAEGAHSMVVIIGEDHRQYVARRLITAGFDVESARFPDDLQNC